MSTKPTKNHSKLLYLQARYQFEKALEKFEDGTIKTEPRLVQTVFRSFQDFFTSMGKPNMIPRHAPEQGPPWSEDFNEMMNEVRKDLELLYQEVDVLGRSLYADFNHNVMQHDIIQKEYDSIHDKLRDLEIYAGYSSEGVLRFGRDDFMNGSKIDYDKINGIPLELTGGGITLKTKGEPVNVAKDGKVTIIVGNRKQDGFIIGSDSNGFPGNNNEITVVSDPLISSGDIYNFVGRENNHGSYGSVIDGNPNTWFEYERINVREHDKTRIAKNLGWHYQVTDNKTIDFAMDPDNGILKLHMQIVLKEVQTINQINVNMFVPPNYGAKAAIVKNILVSEGTGSPQVSILKNATKKDDYTFNFQPTKAKVVSIMFEQDTKYFTDIGHVYFEKKMNIQDPKDYVFDTVTKQYKPKYSPRVEGPRISIDELGAKIDVGETDVNVYYPMKEASQSGYPISDMIARISSRIDTSNIDSGVERFEGWRWCIGIRDIEILSCEYETEGELVTKPFYFDKPLDKVSLSVQEALPALFTNSELMKYDWIRYFVSIDDGGMWHPITPLDHELIEEGQAPKIYTIRKVASSESAVTNKEAYLESEYPVYSLRLKIVLTRPDEDSEFSAYADGDTATNRFATPNLHSYMFNVETIEEGLDSLESGRKVSEKEWLIPSNEVIPLMPVEEAPVVEEVYGAPRVFITNKKEEWCHDVDLHVKGTAESDNSLTKLEFIVNGQIKEVKSVSGSSVSFDFIIPSSQLTMNTFITAVVKAYDQYESAHTSDAISIIDCSGLSETEKPTEDNQTKLAVSLTNKIAELCMCHDLVITGVASGPHPVDTIKLLINNMLVDPYNIGFPTMDSPCGDIGYTPPTSTLPEENAHIQIQVDNLLNEYPYSVDGISITGTITSDAPLTVAQLLVNGYSVEGKTWSGTTGPTTYNYSFEVKPPTLAVGEHLTFRIRAGNSNGVTHAKEWTAIIKESATVAAASAEQAFYQKQGCFNPNQTIEIKQQELQIMANNETTFNWVIPYWKLFEMGVQLDSLVNIKVVASDGITLADDNYSFTVIDCTVEAPVAPVSDCYKLESILVSYYNEEFNRLDTMEVATNLLPFEFNNGEGTLITVGWNQTSNAAVVHVTGGYNSTGVAAQIHAVGIRYTDFNGEEQLKWSTVILKESANNRNSYKMPGDPLSKDSIGWLTEVRAGDYSQAPSLGGINDYIYAVFDSDWVTNSCGFNMNYAPESLYFDPNPEENPLRTKVRDCNMVTKFAFQYLDDINSNLKHYQIELGGTYTGEVAIQTKNGMITIFVGWYDDVVTGPMLAITSATGIENVLLSAFGLVYQDMYGDLRTKWISGLRYKTDDVKNETHMYGAPKKLSELSWVTVESVPDSTSETGYRDATTVDYQAAPSIGQQDDGIVGLLDQLFIDSLCIIQASPNIPNLDTTSPMITFNAIADPFCYQDLNADNTITVSGSSSDYSGIVGWEMLKDGIIIGTGSGNTFTHNVPVTLPEPDMSGRYADSSMSVSVRVWDNFGNEKIETKIINFTDCSPEFVGQVCGSTTQAGGAGVTTTDHAVGSTPGTLTVNYNMYTQADAMDIHYNGVLVASTNGKVSGTGTLSFNYVPVDGNYIIQVTVTGDSGTGWEYVVNCPV